MKRQHKSLIPPLRVCWACGLKQTDHVTFLCHNDDCMASLVPHRAPQIGVRAIRHLLDPDVSATRRTATESSDFWNCTLTLSPIVVFALILGGVGAAMTGGVPWLALVLSPSVATGLRVLAATLGSLTLASFVLAVC
jgi:hypothetical protein